MKFKFLLTFLPILFCFFFLSHSLVVREEEQTINFSQRQQMQEVRLMVSSLETFLSTAAYGLTALPGFPGIQRGSDGVCLRDMEVFFHSDQEAQLKKLAPHQFRTLRRIDRQGIQRYFLDSHEGERQMSVGEDFSAHPAFIGAQQSGQLYITLAEDLHPADGTEHWAIWMAVPAYETIRDHENPDAAGQFSGVVLAEIDADQLFGKYLTLLSQDEDRCVVLIDRRSGRILFHNRVGEHVGRLWSEVCCRPHEMALSGFQPLRDRLFRGAFGSASYLDRDGEVEMASFMPLQVGNLEWSLLVETPEKSLTGSLSDFHLKMTLNALLAFGAFLGLFLLMTAAQRRRLLDRERVLLLEELEGQVSQRTGSLQRKTEELEATYRALQAESRALEASRQEYRFLVEGVDFGIMRVSPQGRIQFCNKALSQLAGGDCRSLHGCNLIDLELIDADGRQRLQEALGQIRDGVSPAPFQVAPAPAGQQPRCFDLQFSPIRLDGVLAACLIIFRPASVAEIDGTGER